MAEYQVHDPEKGLIGPVSLKTVLDLVEAGVVHDRMWVSRDGGPFLPISAFAEISPQPADDSSSEPQPTYSGDLGANTFFKVFYRFHLTHSTGLLVVQRGEHRKDIYLDHGQPVYVSSTFPGERFGEFLVARNKIDVHELEVALGSMHTDDNRLGYTLIRLGLMEPKQLFEALREQQTSRLVELCTWETGRYSYFDGERYKGDMVDLKLAVPDLVIEAARNLRLKQLQSRLAPHAGRIVDPQPNQVVPPEELRLSGFEKRIADAIDGQQTLGQIVANLKGDRLRAAMMVLYLLWEIDAISFR